nr:MULTISPECIES: ATP-binding protein [Ramlibacter]
MAEGTVRRTAAAHQSPEIERLLAASRWSRQENPELLLCALCSGRAALHPQIDEAWYRTVARADQGQLQLLRELGARSMLTVPMRWQGEVLGALSLFMGDSERRHTEADLALAAELVEMAAPLVANARLLEQHLRTETALRLSEERLRTAVGAGQVGTWDWDIAADRTTWSEHMHALYDLPRRFEGSGIEAWSELVHPDDLAGVQGALQDALRGGPAFDVEFRTRPRAGRQRWIATRGHVVRSADGRPLRMVGATTDVTERVELLAAERRARGQAEASRRRMELLASAGERMAVSLEPEQALLAVARTVVPSIADWCRIDLLDDAGVLQRKLAFHSDPQRAAQALEIARSFQTRPDTPGTMAWVIRTGAPFHGHFSRPPANPDPALVRYAAVFGMGAQFVLPLVAHGRTIGAMAVMQAESKRQFDEEDRALLVELGRRAALALDNARLFGEAEAARRQAEAANRAKDEFLAMLGHELRNPLAPIATALELMARRSPQVALEERRVIGRQVNHLSRLIDDLLDVSRITRGKVELQREAIDLRAVAANALEMTRPLFERHEHPVDVELPREPVTVEGDFVRLAQVLGNLLVNAAKFTPTGGQVAVRVRREGPTALVQVQDTGCGIDPALLTGVFDMFVQGRQAMDRRTGGLGLGLAIVRSLVDLHGGDVRAHSDGVGRGATFTVRLPVTETAAAPAHAPAHAETGPGSGRILVVDDNVDAAETLAELLQLLGYETRTAGDAQSALAALAAFRPQVALLDIGLPGIDGYELAGMVRQRPEGSGIGLIALTGYGQESDRARALEAGFDDHLVKPVPMDRLTELIARYMG